MGLLDNNQMLRLLLFSAVRKMIPAVLVILCQYCSHNKALIRVIRQAFQFHNTVIRHKRLVIRMRSRIQKNAFISVRIYISGAGDNNEDWPGLEPAGTKEINGVVYKYFETDVELMNQSLKLTFNNNKKEDDPGLVLSFVKNITFSRDFYFSITPEKCEEIDTCNTRYKLFPLCGG